MSSSSGDGAGDMFFTGDLLNVGVPGEFTAIGLPGSE